MVLSSKRTALRAKRHVRALPSPSNYLYRAQRAVHGRTKKKISGPVKLCNTFFGSPSASLPRQKVGIYSHYLDTLRNIDDITRERKAQLSRISKIRDKDIFVIAAAIGKPATSIDYSDILPIADQVGGLKGTKLDVILETPGGSGEITEEIVRILRRRHSELNFIVPGTAKSAGTIMVMAGDEILMGSLSSLGPIDAQLNRDGKQFSAEAFLQGIEEIKKESDAKGSLNRAFIPILQNISPGEIEAAKNALKFGKGLAARWLEEHKFKHWTSHRTDGRAVTPKERKERAEEIAGELGSHAKWMSHGRSIKIDDLQKMGIRITNFEDLPELSDAIQRYHILLRMTFEMNLVKLYETPTSQVHRFLNQPAPPPQASPEKADIIEVDFLCPNPRCKQVTKLVGSFTKKLQVAAPKMLFPGNNKFTCPICHAVADLTPLRMQIEAQAKRPILS